MNLVASKLEASYRELSLKRNISLENKTKKESQFCSIISLNINGIFGKLEEVSFFLELNKPDVICLQETKSPCANKRVHMNGDLIQEVKTSNDSGLGLILGLKDFTAPKKILKK